MAEEPEKKNKDGDAGNDEVIDAAALEHGKETAENKLNGDETVEDQLKSGGDDGLETRHISPVDMLAENAIRTTGAPRSQDKRPLVQRILSRFNIWLLLFFLVLVLAVGTVVVMYALNKKEENVTINTETLTQETLNQLKASDTTVGDPKSTLSVESNAIFAGKVLVRSDLDVAGGLKLGGSLSVPNLNVASAGNFNSLVTNSIDISGGVKIGGKLDLQGGLSVVGDLSVSGRISAAGIDINQLSLTHINITGPRPAITSGPGTGSGGTASIEGNDTTGIVTINVGGLPPAGVLATIKFSEPFNTATPHAIITPNGPGCAALNYYITNTNATQFAIATANAASAGLSCKFNYFVVN